MINPQPVEERSTPYSVNAQTAPLASQPNSQTAPPSEPVVKPKKKWKKWLGLIFVFILSGGATFTYAEYHVITTSVFTTNEGKSSSILKNHITSTSQIDTSDYSRPGDGRINILVMGDGGVNNQGQAHNGTLLTDSIEVMSFDTIHNTLSLTSVPRDFLVNIPGHGQNKVNAVYEYGEFDHPGSGGQAAKDEIGKILGVTITNYVVIDFTAAQDIVDTIGGIDVNVPKSLYDPAYPCDDQLHYCPFSISAGEHHMDGATALKYMRTRHADSDFGRSSRQQLVISAIKDKALSLGVLSNPVKVLQIINELGSHVKTDLQPSDIESLVTTFKDVQSGGITSNVLDTTPQLGLLYAGSNPYAGDVEIPIGGEYYYTGIQEWFAKNNPDPLLGREKPTVTIIGTERTTQKQMTAMNTLLTSYGYTVTVDPTTYPGSVTTNSKILSKNNSKPISEKYLGAILNVTSSNVDGSLGTDFEVVVTPTSISPTATPTPSYSASPISTSTPSPSPSPSL